MKASKTAGDALQMPGLVEFLMELDSKLAALKPPPVSEPSSHDEPEQLDESELVFLLPGIDATKPPSSIKASSNEDGAKRETFWDEGKAEVVHSRLSQQKALS